MTTIKQLQMALNKAGTGLPEHSVESAIAIYGAAQAAIDEFKTIQEQAKALISDVIVETARTSWKTKAGTAQITKSSESVTYDTKALEALYMSSDEIARLLAPHRNTTTRAGTLRITPAK